MCKVNLLFLSHDPRAREPKEALINDICHSSNCIFYIEIDTNHIAILSSHVGLEGKKTDIIDLVPFDSDKSDRFWGNNMK